MRSFFVSLLTVLLCAAFLFGMALPVCAAEAPDLASEAAILMDADTGQILYEKNGNAQMYPASITKIMTGLLVMTRLDPNQIITVSEEAFRSVPRTSSHISLEPGEELTVDQAMHALAMQSANDAANALAEAVSGSMEAFAEEMTSMAHALGAHNTHFTNASGLPDREHYTTAYDMALITAEALKIPGFSDYFSTVYYDMEPTNLYPEVRSFTNPNQILNGQFSYAGVLMSKTGWTSSALGTLVTVAKQQDTTLIAVVLKSQILESKYLDTCSLLDYGFSQYHRISTSPQELARKLSLNGYGAAPGQEYTFLIPEGMEPSDVQVFVTDTVELPHNQTEITVSLTPGNSGLPGVSMILRKEPSAPSSAAAAAIPLSHVLEEPDHSAAGVVIACAILVLSPAMGIWIILKKLRPNLPAKDETVSEGSEQGAE